MKNLKKIKVLKEENLESLWKSLNFTGVKDKNGQKIYVGDFLTMDRYGQLTVIKK